MNTATQAFAPVFRVGDRYFDTKAEALDYIRRPKIEAALNALTENNKELTNWLLDNEDTVKRASEAGVILRVTKSERGQLRKALDAIIAVENKHFAFVQDNADAIVDSFAWPSVKRMDDAEKATAARNTIVAASEGNEELATWVVANKDAILAAYEAGVEKRPVSPKASEGLQAWRDKMAAQKAEEEVAKAAGPEAHAAFKAKIAAEKAAAAKAKADAKVAEKAAKA